MFKQKITPEIAFIRNNNCKNETLCEENTYVIEYEIRMVYFNDYLVKI